MVRIMEEQMEKMKKRLEDVEGSSGIQELERSVKDGESKVNSLLAQIEDLKREVFAKDEQLVEKQQCEDYFAEAIERFKKQAETE